MDVFVSVFKYNFTRLVWIHNFIQASSYNPERCSLKDFEIYIGNQKMFLLINLLVYRVVKAWIKLSQLWFQIKKLYILKQIIWELNVCLYSLYTIKIYSTDFDQNFKLFSEISGKFELRLKIYQVLKIYNPPTATAELVHKAAYTDGDLTVNW